MIANSKEKKAERQELSKTQVQEAMGNTVFPVEQGCIGVKKVLKAKQSILALIF